MFKKILLTSALTATAFAASNAELESRIEELEFANYANFWSFSGEVEARFDTANQSEDARAKRGNLTTDGEHDDYYSLFTRLNVQATPSDRLTFFGRLSMAKYMNSFTERKGSSTITNSGSGGRSKTGAEVYMERAFFNYKMSNSLTLSVGRLPTIDGPSDHMPKGTARSGTYPKLAYGSILDGFALTHSAKVGKNGSLSTRLIYTPLNQVGLNQTGSGADITDGYLAKIDSTENMWSAMLDFETINAMGAKRFNFIAQHVAFKDFYIDQAQDYCQRSPTSGGADDVTNGCVDGLPKTLSGSNLRFDYAATVLYAEMNGMFNTGLDLGLSYKMTAITSKGDLSALTAAKIGALTDEVDKDKESKGSVWLLSARYNFGSKFKLGAEWIKASARAFTVDLNAQDAIGFYGANASEGKHVYAIYDIDSNLRFVVGVMQQDRTRKYTNGIFGAGSPIEVENKAAYGRIIASF